MTADDPKESRGGYNIRQGRVPPLSRCKRGAGLTEKKDLMDFTQDEITGDVS